MASEPSTSAQCPPPLILMQTYCVCKKILQDSVSLVRVEFYFLSSRGAFCLRVILSPSESAIPCTEREFFIDNLLARIHLIIEMILVDRPCAMHTPIRRHLKLRPSNALQGYLAHKKRQPPRTLQ